jgi:hypothetical protein
LIAINRCFLNLRREVVQGQQTEEDIARPPVVCHIEPHFDLLAPNQYSGHGYCIPMKPILRSFGPGNSHLTSLGLDKAEMEDFMIESIRNMLDAKFFPVNVGRFFEHLVYSSLLIFNSIELY